MKISELKPGTIISLMKDQQRWIVETNQGETKIRELIYHCIDCCEEFDMSSKTVEGTYWVDEAFGENWLIESIPVGNFQHGVDYQKGRRVIACDESSYQVIAGIIYETKYPEVLELWPDNATSCIHITKDEWYLEYVTTWRRMPSHKGYEMSPEGRVRNARTGQEVTPSWHGGIMCVSLQSGSQRTTRSANKMYRETYPELPQPLYNGKEKLL